MKNPLKIVGFTLYFVLLIIVVGKLFFETQFDAAIQYFLPQRAAGESTLTIGYADSLISLNPLANDTGSRSRLLSVYEALTAVTPDLQIKPSLAISYGFIDDTTWEFRLRPGVSFHNGAPLTIEDVIFSLEQAKSGSESGVKDLASTIKEIKKVDEEIFRIITNKPDPLLLNKLSSLLIFAKGSNEEKFYGTGPYAVLKNENGSLYLQRFPGYWGDHPSAKQVILKTVNVKAEKLAALKNGEVDILANLPADMAANFDFKGFELKTRPSLEVNFLMFNFDKIFASRELRNAVRLALKTEQLVKLAQGFAIPVYQFVSDGIFGYDPSIPVKEYDVEKAKELVAAASKNAADLSVTLDLPKGLETFGPHVASQLKEIGISVNLNYLSPQELGEKITSHKSEFYFFGWRTDLGDASDFLTAVAHSSSNGYGGFNGGSYKSSEVDSLIEMSSATIEGNKRLAYLRDAMRRITVDDIIGIPLFSPEVLYGVSKRVKWAPRVDSYVLAQEVKM